MTALLIPRGTKIELLGGVYQVMGCPADAVGEEFNLVADASGHWKTLTAKEIADGLVSGDMRMVAPGARPLSKRREEVLQQPFDSFPEHLMAIARRRYQYVKGYYEHPRRSLSAKTLAAIIEVVSRRIEDVVDFSTKTLARWIRAYEEAGGSIRGLVPDYANRGPHNWRRLSAEVVEIIEDIVEEALGTSPPPSMQDVYAQIICAIDAANDGRGITDKLVHPHQKTIEREFLALGGRTLTEWKRGIREANIDYAVVMRGPRPKRPMEEVEIDHCILNVLIIDKTYGIVIGRVWLTLAFDRATAMPVGYYLSIAPPSYRSIMMCLRSTMRPKTGLRERFPELLHDWDAFGVPETIIVDNGKDFRGLALEDACADIGINVTFCPARKPWFKGRIERFFGTLARDLLHQLPGTTFASPKERGDYPSKVKAILTLAELEELVIRWMVDIYANREHRGIKDVPSCKWRALVGQYPVRPARKDQIEVLLNQVEYRRISRKGVEYRGLHFNSYDIGALRERPGADGRIYKIKIDPADLSYIFVEDPDSHQYIKVPSLDPEYTTGLSLTEHDIITNYVRTQNRKGPITISMLARARVELRAKAKEMAAKNRTLVQKGALLLDGPDSLSPPRTPAASLPSPSQRITPPAPVTANDVVDVEWSRLDEEDLLANFEEEFGITVTERSFRSAAY